MPNRSEPHGEHHDCWNQIGVFGDGTCPELVKVVHCRNCPVYAAGGRSLLEREPPADYLREWTQALAEAKDADQAEDTLSVLIFRLGREWLALPTHVCQEVAEMRPIHTLPHRSGPVLLGLVNIRGQIRLCVSLRELLRLEPADDGGQTTDHQDPRCLVVIAGDSDHWVILVDELHGIQRFHLSAVREAPVTVAKAAPRLTKRVITWRDRGVGYLDDDLLFLALRKEVL
ncbi:MAG TPA: chemotaxis protein CheW [Candidatus Tectomicrobia bacterium]|nr:chemotaxis protein CheW [Candidatus Tectomicrobia bacterium]